MQPGAGPDDRGDHLARRLEEVSERLARSSDPLIDPFEVRFDPAPGPDVVAAWRDFARAARRGEVYDQVVLYLHVPFCAKTCSYCLLASRNAPARRHIERYVAALCDEMERYGDVLEGLPIAGAHVGGGTPTLLKASELDAILSRVASEFAHKTGFTIGVECHPATTKEDKLDVLAKHGVGRLSFGIETLTPEVLAKVNRSDQTLDRVQSAMAAARRAGIESINVDVLAGLPGETDDSFARSLKQILDLDVDSMSVNRYIAENSPLAAFGYLPDDASTRLSDRMLLAADEIIRGRRPPRWPPEPLARPAFGTQYVWDRTNKARRYFQQDMIGASSTLALGHGGMGHVHGAAYWTAAGTPDDYVEAIQSGQPTPVLKWPISKRFEMAFYFADGACRDRATESAFRSVFRESATQVFGPELRHLEERGLLVRDGGSWSKPPNPKFQVMHLIAFLCPSDALLSESRESRPEATRRDEAHPAQLRPTSDSAVYTDGGSEPGSQAKRIDVVDEPSSSEAELVDLLERVVRVPRMRIAVWTSPARLAAAASPRRLATAGATQIVLSAKAIEAAQEPELDSIKTRCDAAGLELCAHVRPRTAGEAERLLRGVTDAGVRRVVLDLDEHFDADDATRVLDVVRRGRLEPEVVMRRARAVSEEYERIGVELPPSLFWCRIAIRSAAANREHQRMATLRF